MRDFPRSIPRCLQAGWLLPLVLLALPADTVITRALRIAGIEP